VDEYERRLREFRDHFGDLIDEETLRMLVDYSFGRRPRTKISEIASRWGKVTVEGVVEKVLGFREFVKGDRRGLVVNAILCDDEGRVRIAFWNDAAELFRTGDLKEGYKIRVRAFVKRREEGVELSVNDPSDVEIVKEKIRGIVLAARGDKVALKYGKDVRICVVREEVSRGDVLELVGTGGDLFLADEVRRIGRVNADDLNVFTPINRIIPLRRVNLRGRVCGLNGLRIVRDKDLAEITIADETDRVRVLLWEENARVYREVDIGDFVEVYNGYPKIGWDGEIEVHCGRSTILRVIRQ